MHLLKKPMSKLGLPLAISIGILVASLVFAYTRFGGIRPAIAYLRGYPAYIIDRDADLGAVHGGTSRTAAFTLINLDSTSTTIVGLETTCGCLSAEELPLSIKANTASTLALRIEMPYVTTDDRIGNTFVHRATVFFDKQSPPLNLSIRGTYVY